MIGLQMQKTRCSTPHHESSHTMNSHFNKEPNKMWLVNRRELLSFISPSFQYPPVPAHRRSAIRSEFQSTMYTIRVITLFYLKSIDTLVRLLGTYLITGAMICALGMILHSINWVFFGSFSSGPLHPWIGIILLPPILRIGILAGGFSIPPLFNRQVRTKGIPIPAERGTESTPPKTTLPSC